MNKQLLHLGLLFLFVFFCFLHAEGKDENSSWQKIIINGHKKAPTLFMELTIPASWTVKAGIRPHILKKAIAPKAKCVTLIFAKDLGQSVSQSDAENMFDETTIREILPKNAVFQKCVKTKLESLPAWLVMYTMLGERLGVQIIQMHLDCILVYDKYLINLQSAYSVQPKAFQKPYLEATIQEYQKAIKLFMMILNSVVIRNVYK